MCSDARGEEKKGSQRTTGKPEFARRWQMFKNNLQQPRTLVSLHGFLSFFLCARGCGGGYDRRSRVASRKIQTGCAAGRAVFVSCFDCLLFLFFVFCLIFVFGRV